MGNCCEIVDKELEEVLLLDDLDTSYNNACHSRSASTSTAESYPQSSLADEAIHKFSKYRYPRIKLKTIIEDNLEDLISSPFLLKRV